MQSTGKIDRQFRYRAYFWLMNASFFAIIYSFVELLVGRVTGFDPQDYMPTFAVPIFYGPILVFMFLVPMFLICARFMRDEYAEQLWRRTSVVLAYATAATPLLCFILGWIWYFATGHTDAKQVHWSLRWMADKVVWGDALMYVWIGYMMVFVVIFQFLRWRDS
ncbi:hypothetical protein [Porphyrobacter sp. ULC335]|uniref:hypothetical protein n=1 Tax=Porphyrobacter sp. ULC335 TaxID=2854260 RepID=UPI0022206196|nr:hypothetical protein [Porphyrobacter sp. ULC335]UYV14759.1 hypothetical protein KVF90_11455 [Porphyrobacter sp. ULC335]